MIFLSHRDLFYYLRMLQLIELELDKSFLQFQKRLFLSDVDDSGHPRGYYLLGQERQSLHWQKGLFYDYDSCRLWLESLALMHKEQGLLLGTYKNYKLKRWLLMF